MTKSHKKRGRKQGSKNKFQKGVVCPYLIDIILTCCHCKKVFAITTNKNRVEEVYTKEVKKNWSCKLGACK